MSYDADEQEEVRSSTLRVRSKITKSARGGYAVEQTIELACPISHWKRNKETNVPYPVIVVGFTEEGREISTGFNGLYAAALLQAGESLMDEVKRRQQAEGGLRIAEDTE